VVAITSSRGVNHPLGRNQDLVCVGDGGIIKNVAIPIRRDIRPSIRNSHLKSVSDYLVVGENMRRQMGRGRTANLHIRVYLSYAAHQMRGNLRRYYTHLKTARIVQGEMEVRISCKNLCKSH
jgi:hypothetical protein